MTSWRYSGSHQIEVYNIAITGIRCQPLTYIHMRSDSVIYNWNHRKTALRKHRNKIINCVTRTKWTTTYLHSTKHDSLKLKKEKKDQHNVQGKQRPAVNSQQDPQWLCASLAWRASHGSSPPLASPRAQGQALLRPLQHHHWPHQWPFCLLLRLQGVVGH